VPFTHEDVVLLEEEATTTRHSEMPSGDKEEEGDSYADRVGQ
jgi:hypothetical protein